MVILLEILDGSKAGQKCRLWEGARIGRTSGELVLDDSKVSSIHAEVKKDAKGNLILVDQNSANGIKINGRTVKRVAMLPGVVFLVGRISLRVVELLDEAPPAQASEEMNRPWKEQILEKLASRSYLNPESSAGPEPFRPAIELEFIEGVRLDQKILLGFGPRQFGASVLDVELTEPMCPPLAFEIFVKDGAPTFRTQYPKLVLYNNKSTQEALLQEGDNIRVGQTLLLVRFAT